VSRDRKTPVRTCVSCRSNKDKTELIRVVRRPDRTVALDETMREPGRGAYICKDVDCLEKAKKQGILKRSLAVELDEEMYERLERAVGKTG